jgi:hypothetical protein
MNLAAMWFYGVSKPDRMLYALLTKPAPSYGLMLVSLRFIVTSLTSILSLYLLKRLPFAPSYLSFLSEENYYGAELFFLPVWGIGVWILMGGIAHVTIRISGKQSSVDSILNIIAMGMIVPMPFLWLWDWGSIAIGHYQVINQAVSHSVAQLWEATIQALAFRKLLRLKTSFAFTLAIIINIIYILMATIFIR